MQNNSPADGLRFAVPARQISARLPGIVQPRTPASAQSMAPPPVYRPQERRSAVQMQIANGAATRLAAPPPYRPQQSWHAGGAIRPPAAPPVYAPKAISASVQPNMARSLQPKTRPIAPLPYHPQLERQGLQLPLGAGTAYVQRKIAGAGVIQCACSICGGDETWTADANGDQVNGHLSTCPRYHRIFQTAADRNVSGPLGMQRSHSFRELVVIDPGGPRFEGSLFVNRPRVETLARVHQHDNNISGGGTVAHYR